MMEYEDGEYLMTGKPYNNKDLMNRTEDEYCEDCPDTTESILKERGSRYGEFKNHAEIAQTMKAALWEGCKNSGKEDYDIPDFIWESMDMICHKLARVVNGDCLYDDNFIDIAGYAELVVKELQNE